MCSRPSWRRLARALPILAACAAPAAAAELHLGSDPYSYTVIDQDLRTALHEFGANLGLRVSLSDAVQGRIRGRLPPLPPIEFLNRLMAMYGLDWYYDGYTLSITAQSEGGSKIIVTPGVPFPALKAGLEALGVLDERYVARPQSPGSDLVLVGGPPRYLQLVEQAVGLLVTQAAQAAQATPPPALAPALPGRPAAIPAAAPARSAAPAPAPRGLSLTIYRASQGQRVDFPTAP